MNSIQDYRHKTDTHTQPTGILQNCPAIASFKCGCEATFVGPAWLLPEALRRRYSCAGLCYVQVIAAIDETLYRVEVAALDESLRACTFTDAQLRRRHVMVIHLTDADLACFLEYDRRLAGMATCDVRDFVEDHARTTIRAQRRSVGAPAAQPAANQQTTSADMPPVSEAQQQAAPESKKNAPEPMILVAGPTVTLSLAAIRAAWKKWHATPGRIPEYRQLLTLVLHIVIDRLDRPVDRRAASRLFNERRRLPELIALVPVYTIGATPQIAAYEVRLALPYRQAA